MVEESLGQQVRDPAVRLVRKVADKKPVPGEGLAEPAQVSPADAGGGIRGLPKEELRVALLMVQEVPRQLPPRRAIIEFDQEFSCPRNKAEL